MRDRYPLTNPLVTKRSIVLAAMVLALTACGKQQEAAAPAAAPVVDVSAPVEQAAAPVETAEPAAAPAQPQ